MRLRSLALLLGASLTFASTSCDGGAQNSDWVIRFPDATIQGLTTVIVARIHSGDCTGPDVYAVEVRTDGTSGGMPTPPPVLGKGSYGLTAEARDATCNVIARGCTVLDLPKDGAVVVNLTRLSPTTLACAPDLCLTGTCTAADAGPPMDGGLDAGGDAGTDAGPPACSTEGERCPSGGICHAGGCCTGCWSGVSCFSGTEPAGCGPAEGACAVCTSGNACRASACLDEASSPQFALSTVNSFVRLGDGRVWSAGDNANQQLGPRGGSTDGTRYAQYSGDERFTQMASAQLETCGLVHGCESGCPTRDDGAIYCWGLISGTTPTAAPTRLGADTFNQISGGNAHFCAIRTDGRLYCFGANAQGQLGVGGSRPTSAPAAVLSSATWSRVSAGTAHTCGIQSDGSLWCWGSDEFGQIGNGDPAGANFDTPQRVGMDSDWLEVSAGVAHTCAVKGADRQLWCWGAGGSGRLGLGAMMDNQPAPMRVGSDTGWANVAAGQFHSCGVRSGEGFCWGIDVRGALGVADMMDHSTPASLGMGWQRIWTGWTHSCGVQDGMLKCWGENTGGRLGVGDTVWRFTPTPIGVP